MADKYVIGDGQRRQLQETYEITRSLSPKRGKRELLRPPARPPVDRGGLLLFRATITGYSSSTRAHSWRRATQEADVTSFPVTFTDWPGTEDATAKPGAYGTVDTYPAYDPLGNIHPSGTPVLLTPAEDTTGARVFFIVAPRESNFLAQITGHATLASAGSIIYKWKYAWSEVHLDGDTATTFSGSRSGTTATNYAINTREINHTSEYVWGIKVNGADYPAGSAPRAVGGAGANDTHAYNVVVEMTERTDVNGDTKYTFGAMGSHDGTCT